ncbi:MAG: pre-mRNA-splicing factor syf2 [Alyxoria varia]|nr:MAG: pre-mRNA-splicing factor syf2 [Alyxoria varia]
MTKDSRKRKVLPEDDEADMPPSKKTELVPESKSENHQDGQASQQTTVETSSSASPQAASEPPNSDVSQRLKERQERFKALQARQSQSRTQNRKETAAESQRLSTDPNLLKTLNRKHAVASHKLLKADTEAAGDDFERKRAWDWTIDESEKWDRRMEKKENHREDVAFQDYRQTARKVYKRQIREMGKPDLEAYEQSKADAVRRAAENGRLEIVETQDGELVAVDKDGTFYSTADTTDFAQNKPDKAAVDRLVGDLKKAEEIRMKKRKERGKEDDDGDITFINEKNKQFNQKLARFYNKYTTEIRDSFERGTAI